MNTRMQTDVWIYRIIVVLGLTVVISVIGTVALTIIGQPIPEIIVALAVVAIGSLARLLIPSPLNLRLFE